MKEIMAGLFECFSWLVDVYLAFTISSVVTGTLLIATWCLWRWLHTKMFFIRWRFKFEFLSLKWKAVSLLSAAGVLATPVFIKAYYISANDPVYTSQVTDIIPSSLLFFQRVTNLSYNMYPFTLHVNKLLVYGSLLLVVPICIIVLLIVVDKEQKIVHFGLVTMQFFNRSISKNRAEFIETYVQLENEQKKLLHRLNIAAYAYNQSQKEISDLTIEVAWLNWKLRAAIDKNKEYENKKPRKIVVKPSKDTSSQEKRYAELQSRHTELMRKYYKLDKKYNELAKEQRGKENLPTALPTYKPGLKGDAALCVICLERRRQFILKPCNHYCVCNECKKTLKNKCPVCRRHIQKFEKLYVA